MSAPGTLLIEQPDVLADEPVRPSVEMSDIATARAERHGSRYSVRHLRYPDAGHTCTVPAGFPAPLAAVHPVTGGRYAYGGTTVGNAHASASSWRETIEFLRTSLRSST
jgi:BAAT / Acyl-CoA thioester hydrolase C terminal